MVVLPNSLRVLASLSGTTWLLSLTPLIAFASSMFLDTGSRWLVGEAPSYRSVPAFFCCFVVFSKVEYAWPRCGWRGVMWYGDDTRNVDSFIDGRMDRKGTEHGVADI